MRVRQLAPLKVDNSADTTECQSVEMMAVQLVGELVEKKAGWWAENWVVLMVLSWVVE